MAYTPTYLGHTYLELYFEGDRNSSNYSGAWRRKADSDLEGEDIRSNELAERVIRDMLTFVAAPFTSPITKYGWSFEE